MLKVFISQKPRLLLEKKLYLTSIHRHQPIFLTCISRTPIQCILKKKVDDRLSKNRGPEKYGSVFRTIV
jgi:hypothetical protein